MINLPKITRNKVFVGLILSLLLILLTIEEFSVHAEPQTTQSAYDSKNSNTTPKKAMIIDPTGKTEGYILEDFSDNFFELMGSRDQSSRHFYNKRTGAYTYQSDHLVQKEGVFEETAWVTAQEYPYRFILRMQDGTMHFFEDASDISTNLETIERGSIWAVGFESFAGVMGFYLNFQDSVHGHGQYLYWPRLNSGKISAYNMPLYAIYPHLYLRTGGLWLDQILSDRILYSGENQSP